jgi:hypothetical protein
MQLNVDDNVDDDADEQPSLVVCSSIGKSSGEPCAASPHSWIMEWVEGGWEEMENE